MKIVLTGGGTGGHFFPLISVAEEIRSIIEKEKILPIKLYYFSDSPYDKRALFENDIKYVYIPAGKNRLYGGIQNYIDMIKLIPSCIQALIKLFSVYPDVVFSKGGYASFPTLFAAKILRIPVVIHESDTIPGRVSLWSAKFATKIAISHPTAASYFPKEKTALTGIPLRKEVRDKAVFGMQEFFNFKENIKTIFIIGGSSGSETINEIVLDSLNILLKDYQIIHQVGSKSFEEIKSRINVVVSDKSLLVNYKLFGLMNPLEMKMAAGIADLVITRAGSTSLAEISSWGLPSIVIPIPEGISRDQRTNAYEYARLGAGEVIEQSNLSPAILSTEIDKILSDQSLYTKMSKSAKENAKQDAGKIIAEQLVRIVLDHQK
jgi:UDP-N-acetylglucosamine--N-acetylmuramyl-(pentapeptide) pyrophosphoryl-undecaprenol N-acetylglucosamine transferase